MWNQTPITQTISCKYPIIQAPMAGGATTPELVAAVSNAGALGSIGGGYLFKDQLRQVIQNVRYLSTKPFAVNLFIPEEAKYTKEQVEAMNEILSKYRKELGIETTPNLQSIAPNFEEQFSLILEMKIPVFSFTFGLLSEKHLFQLKKQSIYTIGTATNVKEAKALQKLGVDAICAQGSEAGGHRGTFIGKAEDSLIGIMTLIPQIVKTVKVPVIAAGGIMDAQSIRAALDLGASAVQMGTAFLACPESGVPKAYKEALFQESTTAITRAFSGKAARGLRNRFLDEMEAFTHKFLPYPAQNALTRDIRFKARETNRAEYLSLWAGQGFERCQRKNAAKLIEEWVKALDATHSV